MVIGTTLGRYRLVEKLGEGGMGVVYRAHDERLGRDVALKVLAANLLDDQHAAERFRQEARVLSRLNHPNIAAVYDFDTQAGVSFLTMEYVAGPTLAHLVARDPLPETDWLPLAVQLAEGLVAAHRDGVVHRDLKPANVRLTADGRLKILDFGLAKLLAPAAADAATATLPASGAVMGTVPYMAPEQLRGQAVDPRSDIYAAGAILYELATGRRLFTASVTTASIIDAILHTVPLPPGRVRPEIPAPLEALILKCVEKDAEYRYQTAADLLADLRRHAAGSGPLPVESHVGSLAVLPFQNYASDQSQQYFVDGMTDTLTTYLAQIRSIRVAGHTSAMQFRDTHKPVPEIARTLDVDAVVEGSVLREGDTAVITARLVAVRPERHLWSGTYERQLKHILQVHKEVAQAIAHEIRATLSPDEETRLAKAPAVNPAAHEAYLRGRHGLSAMTPEGVVQAEADFKEAIRLDPSFAPAYASMAFLRMWAQVAIPVKVASATRLSPREIGNLMRGDVAKALELDPTLPEAVALEGAMNLYADWDWGTASRRLKRGLEANPNDPSLYHPYADALLIEGRLDESLAYCRQGAALDPLSPFAVIPVVAHLVFLHRFDEALAVLDEMEAATSSTPLTRTMRAGMLWQMGDLPAALEWFEREGGPAAQVLRQGAAQGGPIGAARAMARMLTEASKKLYVSPLAVATWFARADEADQALEWLEKAYQERSPFVVHLRADHAFDGLRSDPRFETLLQRIGLPQIAGSR